MGREGTGEKGKGGGGEGGKTKKNRKAYVFRGRRG